MAQSKSGSKLSGCLVWLVGLAVIGVLGYVAVGPYLLFQKLRSGIEQRDAKKIGECVDFPRLRESVKAELAKTVAVGATATLGQNPLGAIAAGIASTAVDVSVDVLVTPEGLERLIAGEKMIREPFERSDARRDSRPLLDDVHYSYEATDRFVVVGTTRLGKNVRLVLFRDGIDWKLGAIELESTMGKASEQERRD
jgi:hypothetical protein